MHYDIYRQQSQSNVQMCFTLSFLEKSKKHFKRIRVESQESLSPDAVSQPRKRIRQISTDSGGDDVNDSQGTVAYSLESQRSDATVVYDVEDDIEPPTEDQKKKIGFMSDCFRHVSHKVQSVRNNTPFSQKEEFLTAGLKNCSHSYSSCRASDLKNTLALQENLLPLHFV